MPDHAEDTKRIAKNTVLLYIRTLVTMIVGLYTGRIMLQALGVENYGVNNVVGSIVSMTSLITGVMSAAISRYLTFELGRGDLERLKTVFSTSINAQALISLLVIVILEFGGVWFLNTQANIPDARMVAANWVMQCAIFSTVVSLLSSPYGAVIIAHEHMSVYAYMTIAEVTLKLLVCFLIMTYGGDRLILLSVLNLVVSLLLAMFYAWYCSSHFVEAHYEIRRMDKPLLKEMTAYSGWNLFGNTTWILNNQGVNMLLNVFYGVTFNAARGIATTVNGAIQSFVGNFTTAFSPQITKSYASGDLQYAIKLSNSGTKFSWLMSYLFIVPVFMEADTLLWLWLGDVPEYAALFLRFTLFESLAVTSGQTLFKLIQATGDIKRYQIVVSIFAVTVFPISYCLFKLGAPVWTPYLAFIIVYFSLNLIRFSTLKRLMGYSAMQFVKDVLIPCVIVSFSSFLLPVVVAELMAPSIIRFLVMVPLSVLWTGLCSYIFGLDKIERLFFREKFSFFISRLKR